MADVLRRGLSAARFLTPFVRDTGSFRLPFLSVLHRLPQSFSIHREVAAASGIVVVGIELVGLPSGSVTCFKAKDIKTFL